jgi:hypothetical protein
VVRLKTSGKKITGNGHADLLKISSILLILKPKYFDQGVKMAIPKSKRSGLRGMPVAETLI